MSGYYAAPHAPKLVSSTGEPPATVSPANQSLPVVVVLCGSLPDMCASAGSRRLSMSRVIMIDEMLAGCKP
jgi:hypothetical protein